MSKAAELAALIGSQTALSNRNVIINGEFQIWQRGTSTTSDGYQTADRYQGSSQNGAATMSQQSFTIGQTDVPGEPKYYYRHNQTTQATDYMPNIQHRIEGVRSLAGQRVTLSLYAKASKSLALKTYIFQHFGSGGSPSSGVVVENSPTIATLTTSWQKVTYTFDVDSINGKTIGSNGDDYLAVYLQFPTSDTYSVDLALLQLEVGEQATPFEHRSFADELARCQRYFTIVCGNDDNTFTNTHAWTAQEVIGHLGFGKVEMRTNPTMSKSDNTHFQIRSGGISETSDNVSFVQSNKIGHCRAEFSGSGGLTTGRGAWVKLNTTSGYIHADAEL